MANKRGMRVSQHGLRGLEARLARRGVDINAIGIDEYVKCDCGRSYHPKYRDEHLASEYHKSASK